MPPNPTKMVKAPRSKGCRMCVQRRIKCDLSQPVCMRCVKGNRACPGYEPTFKFLDEGSKLREHYQKSAPSRPSDQYRFSQSPSDNSESSTCSLNPLPEGLPNLDLFDSGQPTSETEYRQPSSLERYVMLAVVSPSAHQAQLLSQFVNSFPSSNYFEIAAGNHTWNTWLRELASYTSSSLLLDDAIRAISLSYLGRSFGDETIILYSRQQYGKALTRLNATLQDPIRGASTETLISTVILSFYEILNSTFQGSWVRHARGVSQLLQIRGAELHQSGIAMSTLSAYRSFLIVEAIATRKPCFLNSSSWRKCFREISNASPRDAFRDALETYYTELARHPGFLHAVIANSTANSQVLEHLLWKGKILRSSFKDAQASVTRVLVDNGLEPVEMSSRNNDAVFPIVYKYPSTYIGSVYCAYWTELTVLDQTLKRLQTKIGTTIQQESYDLPIHVGPGLRNQIGRSPIDLSPVQLNDVVESSIDDSTSQSYDLEMVDNARKSCMSVENLASNVFLGSAYLVFALRAAAAVLDSALEKNWIQVRLQEMSRTIGIAKYAQIGVVSSIAGCVTPL